MGFRISIEIVDLSKLETILAGEPAYRAKQAREAVFGSLIDDWSQARELPENLRQKLAAECSLDINAEIFHSKDGASAKALITLADGAKIETVLMRHGSRPRASLAFQAGRNTVCVSSQVGCPMGCAFCATGKMGFKRNLSADEIAEQVLLFARILKKEGRRVDNVVFMGMGEPFLNYANVMAAVKILNDQRGLNIGGRHISISTCGVVEGIEKLVDEPIQVNLAISLHAPNDALRSKLMPINAKYPLKKPVETIARYIERTNRRVMLEYIMIDKVNDSDDCARELADLVKTRLSPKLAFVNLIRYNPTGEFLASPPERVKAFKDILMKAGVETTERYRFGRQIKAACGQLAAKS